MTGRPGRPTREEAARKKRVPLGRPRFRLSASKHIPPGKVGRWINDDPGRLSAAEEAGYTFVTDPSAEIGEGGTNERDGLTTKIRRRVGARDDHTVKMAYLMVIDKELYEQDQKDKQRDIDRTEEGLRRGDIEAGLPAHDGRYTPTEGIKIQHKQVARRST